MMMMAAESGILRNDKENLSVILSFVESENCNSIQPSAQICHISDDQNLGQAL